VLTESAGAPVYRNKSKSISKKVWTQWLLRAIKREYKLERQKPIAIKTTWELIK
jgi:hypothetical protein